MEYTVGKKVLGDWVIKREIGKGAFGHVFEIEKSSYGIIAKSALKLITIPASKSDIQDAYSEGLDSKSISNYFEGVVKDIVQEIALLNSLKSCENVVNYEDHQIIEYDNEIRWDVLLRMELLTPLIAYMSNHSFSEDETIRLGIDMCKALVECEKHSIIHRDIKPENIFMNESGTFKLGDFGVSRTMEKTSGASKKGTESYMAPEIYRGRAYGKTVDIYSLGIVLYRLRNNGRQPFFPPAPEPIRFSDKEMSMTRRMRGEPLPPPPHASKEFAEIILKACMFDPQKRYATPGEMLQALMDLQEMKRTGKKKESYPARKIEETPVASQSAVFDVLKEGNYYLSVEQWDSAKQQFEIVLSQNPKHFDACFGLLKADLKIKDHSLIPNAYIRGELDNNECWTRVLSCGNSSFLQAKKIWDTKREELNRARDIENSISNQSGTENLGKKEETKPLPVNFSSDRNRRMNEFLENVIPRKEEIIKYRENLVQTMKAERLLDNLREYNKLIEFTTRLDAAVKETQKKLSLLEEKEKQCQKALEQDRATYQDLLSGNPKMNEKQAFLYRIQTREKELERITADKENINQAYNGANKKFSSAKQELENFPALDKIKRHRELTQKISMADECIRIIENKALNAGDELKFGRFSLELFGMESALEWNVLSNDGNGTLLLLSKYVVDGDSYSKTGDVANWENSVIRQKLNSSFYATAFNETEQKIIKGTVTGNGSSLVQDHVFLLSMREARECFKSDEQRVCMFTNYAKEKGIDGSNGKQVCSWWLRDVNRNLNKVMCIGVYGRIFAAGEDANKEGIGIRPVLCIDEVEYCKFLLNGLGL